MASRPTLWLGLVVGGQIDRVLHVIGIESAVFDLDADRHARAQGRMLDIHEDSGQAALHAAELHELFRARVHPGGEALRVLDRHAHLLLEETDAYLEAARA